MGAPGICTLPAVATEEKTGQLCPHLLYSSKREEASRLGRENDAVRCLHVVGLDNYADSLANLLLPLALWYNGWHGESNGVY